MSQVVNDKSYLISFQQKFIENFQKETLDKIAVLVTNEYEGFSRNGGIGTYYTNLSQKLAKAGWQVWLIYCQCQDKFAGKSNVSALTYVFSTAEIEDVLTLTNHHQEILKTVKDDFYFQYQSVTSAFFAQAISLAFPNSKIYFEFPDVNGFSYHTLQAKNSKLLHENCRVAITIHGCFEWVYEANDSINTDDWYNHSIFREQYSFENVDLAFFPSYFLKEKIESFGWQTNHAQNMPYFVGIIPIETYTLPSEINPEITNLLDMTSIEERSYMLEYSEKNYTGQGEIVDLGCWLGSLTIPLAIGLEQNKNINNLDNINIQAYDIFIGKNCMNSCVTSTNLANQYQQNQSFVEAFEERIKPWHNRIKTYVGDLKEFGYQVQKPIEFLFVNAIKSFDLANTILHNFFPFLIPNLSLVYHQGFSHYYYFWIHLIMYRLREYFEPLIYVPLSSVIFKNIKAIPLPLLQNNYTLADFSPEEIRDAFDYSLSIVPDSAKPNIAASKVMLYIHLGDLETAKKELNIIQEKGLYSFDSDLSIVRNILNSSC